MFIPLEKVIETRRDLQDWINKNCPVENDPYVPEDIYISFEGQGYHIYQ